MLNETHFVQVQAKEKSTLPFSIQQVVSERLLKHHERDNLHIFIITKQFISVSQ